MNKSAESPRTAPTSETGFSLIELVVVIAVIGILALLQTTAFARAKQKSHDITCIRNCRQLVLAMTMYVNNANGRMMSYNDPSGGYVLWLRRLQNIDPTAQQAGICPAAPCPSPPSSWTQQPGTAYTGFGLADYPWNWDVFGTSGQTNRGSYGFNSWCFSGLGASQYYTNLAAVTAPSQVPYLSDSVWVDGGISETDTPARNLYSGGDNNGMERITIARHGVADPARAPRSVPSRTPLVGNITVGFVDGHAEPVRLENLWTLYWHKNWVTPSHRPP